MSINGLQQAYIPASLDGLSYLDLDGLTIDGQTVDLTSLVPYTGADKVIDAGAQPIRTSNTPTLATDVVNLATLNSTTVGTIGYVDQYFVPYNGATSDTNLGNRSLTVGNAGQTSFSGVLKTELNNVLAGYTPASIVVGDGFGTITNAGGVYESTSTGPGSFASLFLGNVTPGEKYSVSVSVKCIDPNYTTNVYVYESTVPNLSAGGISLLSFSIPPATSSFNVFSGTFTPTLTKLLLVFNTQIVTGINTLYWNAFSLTGMGTTVKNLISPAAALDGANKEYVDDQIAITAATLVPYTGAVYPLDLGAQDLYAYTARFTNVTSGAPSLALGLDVSGNLRSFAVPPSLTGNNTFSGTNSFTNTVTLSPATATPTFTLGINGSNQIVKYTPSGGIGGSVSAGYVPYASSANVLANSNLFQSGSNVGIGITTPTNPLHVAGAGTFGYIPGSKDGLFFHSSDAYGAPCVQALSSSAGTTVLTINPAGGNVGIGITNPSQKLDVAGMVNAQGGVVMNIGSNFYLYNFGSANNAGLRASAGGDTVFFNGTGGVTDKMFLQSGTGNLGIGKTNPAYRLDILGQQRINSGNDSFTIYQPTGGTWNATLHVGSGTNRNTAQVFATDGNLHLDAQQGNGIYYGYYPYAAGTNNAHRFYGSEYYYQGVPQNYDAYARVCVFSGERMLRSQATIHQVVVDPSENWGPGSNWTYAFYRDNGYTSQMIMGRLSYYQTGSYMSYYYIRVYSQSTGQTWTFPINNFTNVASNHITVPFFCVFNRYFTTTTGWFDIYVYNVSGCVTDTNDILDIHVITLPVSDY